MKRCFYKYKLYVDLQRVNSHTLNITGLTKINNKSGEFKMTHQTTANRSSINGTFNSLVGQ